MKSWEKEVPIGVVEVMEKGRRSTTPKLFGKLSDSGIGVVTSLGDLRGIARSYGKRYNVPIKVTSEDDDIWDSHPRADAVHSYGAGKSVIYLHPILKYYPKSYIVEVIKHELAHREVEKRWEKIL